MKNSIKELRKSKKISQNTLAKKCKVTRQTINAVENNKYDPSLKLAFDISIVLEKKIDDIFHHNY